MIKTRFAPSPTGLLHVGSVRPALVNYLFAKRSGGKYLLRIDDTDIIRSNQHFKDQILLDLKWLGLEWDEIFYQSERLQRYNQVVKILIENGRLYECFETPEELDIKRKLQLSNSKPPIYDRAALYLTAEQKQQYLDQGRKPHYRFKISNGEIAWHDLIRSEVVYKSQDISDPIVIREDQSFTYMLCSVIDDADYNVTHIFRGQDHINNTAIQIQMFQAINADIPCFGHLSFLTAKENKISKRIGGFEVATLRNDFIEPMTINSFFSYIGTAKPIVAKKSLQDLVQDFQITSFSASPTIYNPDELLLLNHKLLIQLDYQDIKQRLIAINASQIDEAFWIAVRANLNNLSEINFWWNICKNTNIGDRTNIDENFLSIAAGLLPQSDFHSDTWVIWTKDISQKTGKTGKELFMPLRMALTGSNYGPEMRLLLPLIQRDQVLKRLGVTK